MGMAIVLAVLLVTPAAGVALAAALILTPVLLFGLVTVPRSLWLPVGLEQRFVEPVRERVDLFQRPPPLSIL